MNFAGFDSKVFRFLGELAENNNRDWFTKNKARFEAEVQAPALSFIEAMRPGLAKISPHILAVPTKAGGSLMRIYRDTRFAKDKSPYHTFVGIQFRHAKGKGGSAPGFYLHLDARKPFIGTGIWQPEPDSLDLIRRRIVDKSSEWVKARGDAAFTRLCGGLAGESLKRPPKGFPPEHPHVNDLKRKDFVGFAMVRPRDLGGAGAVERTLEFYASSKPLMKFLCDAVRLPF